MSRYLESLQQDDWIDMKGPVGDEMHTHELNSQGFSEFGPSSAQKKVFCCYSFPLRLLFGALT
jgi:hypothetical protein